MAGGLSALFHDDPRISVVGVVPPQDGGWSLTPMENLLLGIRNEKRNVALEISGRDGVVSYQVRTASPESLAGMFNSYFSQSRVTVTNREPGAASDPSDWLNLAEDEMAFVQTLHLGREPYLPLRIFDDNRIRESAVDPLAGVIGQLSSSTYNSGNSGSDRMGVRLLMRPAPENWGSAYQSRMQKRRDGDDRTKQVSSGSSADSGPPTGMVVMGGLLFGIGLGNFLLWDSGHADMLLPFNMAATVLGGATLWTMRRFMGSRTREYLDEELIEKKLKSLGFYSELQVVRVYRHPADEHIARASIDNMLHCLGSFDDPAGNFLLPGKLRHYSGQEVFRENVDHPFRTGSKELEWLDPRPSKKTVLSAREAASVWHPALGAEEMASMERVASTTLVPYLSDLVGLSEDSGPLVGVAGKGMEIRLPESAIRKHTMVLGKSGSGKSTLIKHVIGHKLERKAAGLDDSAVVVIDPHSDLVHDILTVVPPEIAHKVRLVDFGRDDRVPGLNLLDPGLFPDRDRCVDTIVTTVRYLWETWGGRLEDLLRRSLSAIYEFNAHPETPRHQMMTMLDVLKLLSDGDQVGSGRDAKTVLTPYQRSVLARCVDPRITEWFETYIRWPNDTRAEAVGPVFSRVGYYANNARASVVMGMRESTLTLDRVLSEGQVLLVATASGTIGQGPAALMGGTVISLVESAIRDQERLPVKDRKKCLLVCDEFQTVTGANWEGMFAEIRKYGCSMMLATQSLARLDTGERKLRSGIMGNVGCVVAHQMAAEDARLVAPELDEERVSVSDIVNIDPRNCIVRINTDTTCYPAFSMKTLPPPDAVRGNEEAAEIVIKASAEYTVDFRKAREAMMAEVSENLAQSKKGSSSDSQYSGAKESSQSRPKSGARPSVGDGRNPKSENSKGAPDYLSEAMKLVETQIAESKSEAQTVSPGVVAETDGASPGPAPAFSDTAGSSDSSPMESPIPPEAVPSLPLLQAEWVAGPENGSVSEPPAMPSSPAGDPASVSLEPVGEQAGPRLDGPDGPESMEGSGAAPRRDRSLPARSRPVTEGTPADGGEYSPVGSDLTGVRRIGSGPLRGIPASDIENSDYSHEFLEELMRKANHDPGVRQVIDKRRGDQIDSDRRKVIESAQAEARETASAEMEEALRAKDSELERIIAEVREESLAQARAELGLQVQARAGATKGSSPSAASKGSGSNGSGAAAVSRNAGARSLDASSPASFGYDSFSPDGEDPDDLLNMDSLGSVPVVPMPASESADGDDGAGEEPSPPSLRRPAVTRRRS